jgi:hypothetical protein
VVRSGRVATGCSRGSVRCGRVPASRLVEADRHGPIRLARGLKVCLLGFVSSRLFFSLLVSFLSLLGFFFSYQRPVGDVS